MDDNHPTAASRLAWLRQQLARCRRPAITVAAVMLAAVLMVVLVGHVASWLTVQRLASRIRTADDSQAGQLVGRLSAFGERAYPALVAAANSDRSAVALAARAKIDSVVEGWCLGAYANPATFSLDAGPLPMALAFEAELPRMTATGQRWSRHVVTELVALAQQQEFDDRLQLVGVCDRVLSALPVQEASLPFDADVDYRLTLAAPPNRPRFGDIGEDVEYVDEPRTVQSPEPPDEQIADTPMPPTADALPQELTAMPMPQRLDWELGEIPAREPAASTRAMSRVPAHEASTARLAPPPTGQGARQEVDVAEVPSIDDRDEVKLFELLAHGELDQQRAAAQALQLRGYGDVAPVEARMLLSASLADRVALVDVAMTSPRLEADRWLWRLAHDPAGEVRAAAIAAISTSGDRGLIEQALELSIRDTDPRVAAQAAMLKRLLR